MDMKEGVDMYLNDLIEKKGESLYSISKIYHIPYMTLNDVVNGKTSLEKCSAETVYKLAKALGVTIDDLLGPYVTPRASFDLFKSNACHALKRLGDLEFIKNTLSTNEIDTYYRWSWYPECLYLLAMLDYISRINNVPLCDKYDEIRKLKMKETIYPSGILILSDVLGQKDAKETAIKECIPEFLRFNIIESDIRNVY